MLTTHSVCVLFHFYPCWISRFHLLHGYHHDCEQCRFEHSWHVHKNIRIQIESVAKINIVNPCASEMGSFASVCLVLYSYIFGDNVTDDQNRCCLYLFLPIWQNVQIELKKGQTMPFIVPTVSYGRHFNWCSGIHVIVHKECIVCLIRKSIRL